MLHFFHVALFPCSTFFSMLHFSVLHFFYLAFLPCRFFFLLHFFHVALFSCCIHVAFFSLSMFTLLLLNLFIIEKYWNERKTENAIKKRSYTKHGELVSLLFWYSIKRFLSLHSFEWLKKWKGTNLLFCWKRICISSLETFKTRMWISPRDKISCRYFNCDIENE